MKWPTHWPKVVLSLLIVGLESHIWSYNHVAGLAEGAEWTSARKSIARYVPFGVIVQLLRLFPFLREKTRALWYHGFDSYMQYGECSCPSSLLNSRF